MALAQALTGSQRRSVGEWEASSVNPKYSDALEAMRTYRKAMTAFLAKAPRRSAIYREAEVAIRQADELALLMTGDRQFLLEPGHRTPALTTTGRTAPCRKATTGK